MEIIDKFLSLNRLLSSRNNEWSVIRDKIIKSLYRYGDLSNPEIIGSEVRLFIQLIGYNYCLYYRFNVIENIVNIHIRKSLTGNIIYNHGDFSILELSKIDLDELNDVLLNKMYDYVTDLIAEPRNRKINIINDDN
jgi:hypothetical protein